MNPYLLMLRTLFLVLSLALVNACGGGSEKLPDNSSTALAMCEDGQDNDGDGLTDLADPGCSSASDNDESETSVLAMCEDGLDNDGDGLTDLADPGCSTASDNDESETSVLAICEDGLDNDGDGLTDLDDPGCSTASDNDETNPGNGNSSPSLLRVSTDNPRYFENAEGKEILLAGSHTWLNAQDGGTTNPPAPFDYDAWLDFLEQHNHNFFRLWTWEQAAWIANEPTKWYVQPPRYKRTGQVTALDGGPRFNLDQFNQDYFDRVRERIIAAGARGMYVAVLFFQGWSVTTKPGSDSSDPWDGHPFNSANNINGIEFDKNNDNKGTELHEINDLTVWQEDFARKMIDTVNDLDNVIYEISNESHSGSTAWQYHMIDFIRNYENTTKLKQHAIGMTYIWPGGNNPELYASPADWISYHGSLDDPVVADGSKVIIADTDHHCGMCGNRSWAWKSFTRGENPLFMDTYIDVYESVDVPLNDPQYVSLRQNLGYIRTYSEKLDLSQAYPCGALASTQNCLGYKSNNQAEFLVYFPSSENISIDLSGANFEFQTEWFNPANGLSQSGSTVTGGSASQLFQAPWSGEAVLYLYKK